MGNIVTGEPDKIEERKKICSKFKACKNDKLYKDLLKSEGIPMRGKKKKNKSKKLKKRYSKKHNNKS